MTQPLTLTEHCVQRPASGYGYHSGADDGCGNDSGGDLTCIELEQRLMKFDEDKKEKREDRRKFQEELLQQVTGGSSGAGSLHDQQQHAGGAGRSRGKVAHLVHQLHHGCKRRPACGCLQQLVRRQNRLSLRPMSSVRGRLGACMSAAARQLCSGLALVPPWRSSARFGMPSRIASFRQRSTRNKKILAVMWEMHPAPCVSILVVWLVLTALVIHCRQGKHRSGVLSMLTIAILVPVSQEDYDTMVTMSEWWEWWYDDKWRLWQQHSFDEHVQRFRQMLWVHGILQCIACLPPRFSVFTECPVSSSQSRSRRRSPVRFPQPDPELMIMPSLMRPVSCISIRCRSTIQLMALSFLGLAQGARGEVSVLFGAAADTDWVVQSLVTAIVVALSLIVFLVHLLRTRPHVVIRPLRPTTHEANTQTDGTGLPPPQQEPPKAAVPRPPQGAGAPPAVAQPPQGAGAPAGPKPPPAAPQPKPAGPPPAPAPAPAPKPAPAQPAPMPAPAQPPPPPAPAPPRRVDVPFDRVLDRIRATHGGIPNEQKEQVRAIKLAAAALGLLCCGTAPSDVSGSNQFGARLKCYLCRRMVYRWRYV